MERITARVGQLCGPLDEKAMSLLFFDCIRDWLNGCTSESLEQTMRERGASEPAIRHYVDTFFFDLEEQCERVYGPKG